jgi:hypothetical protein
VEHRHPISTAAAAASRIPWPGSGASETSSAMKAAVAAETFRAKTKFSVSGVSVAW